MREVLLLFDKVMLVCHIPTQWFPESWQKLIVVLGFDETGGIRVEFAPSVSVVVAQCTIHEFAILLWDLLESLQNDSDKEPHEDQPNENNIRVDKDGCHGLVPASNSLIFKI